MNIYLIQRQSVVSQSTLSGDFLYTTILYVFLLRASELSRRPRATYCFQRKYTLGPGIHNNSPLIFCQAAHFLNINMSYLKRQTVR